MQRLMPLMISTLVGWLGWWLGDFIGFTTAIFVSFAASIIGWYIGVRINHAFLD